MMKRPRGPDGVQEKYGNYNHQFYAKVFELLLRLKANYLWPGHVEQRYLTRRSAELRSGDEYGIRDRTSISRNDC